MYILSNEWPKTQPWGTLDSAMKGNGKISEKWTTEPVKVASGQTVTAKVVHK